MLFSWNRVSSATVARTSMSGLRAAPVLHAALKNEATGEHLSVELVLDQVAERLADWDEAGSVEESQGSTM
jgi:hypothetical protein